ncbi:MAG: winged helix-turn-helix transcriptional regulator [Mesorhizobium sp.]|nr:MAG: winged helix-turn-helix transcriptional regulator [Mesorhizobium sp.]
MIAVVSDRHAVYDHRAQECTYKAHSVEKDTVMPRIRHDRLDCSPGCTVEGTLRYIDGKWKGVVLYHLFEGTLRFSEIRRRIPNCTQRMLTNQLRELEADGLIARKIYPQVPPKVEYSLTPRGRSLEPVITALKTWGDANAALGPQTSQAAA